MSQCSQQPLLQGALRVNKANCTLIFPKRSGGADQGYFLSLLAPVKQHLKYRSGFSSSVQRGCGGRGLSSWWGRLGLWPIWRGEGPGSCLLVKGIPRRWSKVNLSYWKGIAKKKKQFFSITSTGSGARLNLGRFSLNIGQSLPTKWVLQHWTGSPERLLTSTLEFSMKLLLFHRALL